MNYLDTQQIADYFECRVNYWFFEDFKLLDVQSFITDDSIRFKFIDRDNFKYIFKIDYRNYSNEKILIESLKITLLERRMENKYLAKQKDNELSVKKYKGTLRNILDYIKNIKITKKHIIIDNGGIIAQGHNAKKVLQKWKANELATLDTDYEDNQEDIYDEVINKLNIYRFKQKNPEEQFRECVQILELISDPINDFNLKYIQI